MALGNVFIKDVDGAIPYDNGAIDERVSGLLFDVSAQKELFESGYASTCGLKLGDICRITTLKSAEKDFGIIPFTNKGEDTDNLLHGIAYYHIREFFRATGDVESKQELYVMFADCSKDWKALGQLQRASGGRITQMGVWTEQNLWEKNSTSTYKLKLVSDLNEVAVSLAGKNKPLSILLSANTSVLAGDEEENKKINIELIPSCITNCSRTSVLLAQPMEKEITAMQKLLKSTTPVGWLGAALGLLAKAQVHESIGWVEHNNLANTHFSDIEFGFGDMTPTDAGFTSTNAYDSLEEAVLDDLDDKGYIFLRKIDGLLGAILPSSDKTCSEGDYRTIARNRTINKSRRGVRKALLPFVNAPAYVNPATGNLLASQVAAYNNAVRDVLEAMKELGEISGFKVDIDEKQNVLVDDTVRISYRIVPVGTSKIINVEEGFAINTGGEAKKK